MIDPVVGSKYKYHTTAESSRLCRLEESHSISTIKAEVNGHLMC